MPVILDYSIAAVALGRIQTPDLPDLATRLIADGHATPGFVQLAGVMPGERSPSEIDDMWKRAVRELGRDVPAARDAALQLRRHYAAQVATGTLAPADGASEILNLRFAVDEFWRDREWAGDGFGIAKLLGEYYSYDNVPEGDQQARRDVDAAIVAECARLAQVPDGVV